MRDRTGGKQALWIEYLISSWSVWTSQRAFQLGLGRLEEPEESTVHRMVWNPNFSLHSPIQCEEGLDLMDSWPSSFSNGTWILMHGQPIRFLLVPPFLCFSVSPFFATPPQKKTNHHRSPNSNKRMVCVLKGLQSSKFPVSLGEAEIPIPQTPTQSSSLMCWGSHLEQPWRRTEELAFST